MSFKHKNAGGFIQTNAPKSVVDPRLNYTENVLKMKELTQDLLFISVNSTTETYIVDFRTMLVIGNNDQPFMSITSFSRTGFTRLVDAITFRDKCLLERGFVAVDGNSDASGLKAYDVPIGVYGIQELKEEV